MRSASVVVDLARANGATVITEPTDFHGQQQLARFQDPWHNLWWLFEYGATSTAPSEAPAEPPRWRPRPDDTTELRAPHHRRRPDPTLHQPPAEVSVDPKHGVHSPIGDPDWGAGSLLPWWASWSAWRLAWMP